MKTEISSDRQFTDWLGQQNISLVLSTYQTGQLLFLGVNPSGQLSGFERFYDRAMGLYATTEKLYLSCKYQLWQLDNALSLGELYQGYDKLYIPRIGYTTGDIDIHDVAVDRERKVIFVSTLLNCLATISERQSCQPLWKPPFISRIINEDRCHLNGLAMVEGKPRYVTSCSRSDIVDGWRARRVGGGIVIDIASNEIICTGLSMPHSPRWYKDKLWLHNSGRGELGYVDFQTGKFEPVAFCPGYLRGLAFWQNYAIVGLSKPRGGDKTFSGLPLDDILKEKDGEARCGLMVVDLKTGASAHWLRFEGQITELYDLQVLPNVKRPMAIGFQTEEIAQLISLEPYERLDNRQLSNRDEIERAKALEPAENLSSAANKSKKLIVIAKHEDGGFFSNFNKVLQLLKTYNDTGDGNCDFQIDWTFKGNEKSFRYGDVIGENIWNLFFEPLPCARDLAYEETIVTDRYVDLSITHLNVHNIYLNGNFERIRKEYHAVYRQYVKILPDILEEVERIFATYMAGNLCLGVHKRHWLHKIEEYYQTAVSLEDYIQVIKQLLPDSNAVIFLATDEKETVGEMKKIFGDRLICRQDITRTSVQSTVEMHWEQKNRGSHLGRDVLIDALLLAKCDLMIHGISNISTAVSFINPDIEMVYLYAERRGPTQVFRQTKNANIQPELTAKATTQSSGLETLEVEKVTNIRSLSIEENTSEEATNQLRQKRQKLAQYWLTLSPENIETAGAGEMVKTHREILKSALKYEVLTDLEKAFVEELNSYLIENPRAFQYVLALMLYRLPHQLPSAWFEKIEIPGWFSNDYFAYMFEFPQLFQEVGEADNYYYYIRDWITFIHRQICQNLDSKFWQNIAVIFAKNFVSGGTYFNDLNLKDIYTKWAEITKIAIEKQGFIFDYQISKQPIRSGKIRLGILNKGFISNSETFATLPFFEHLDRKLFEIILYAGATDNNPIEKYCQSRCDRLVRLSNDFQETVQKIRDDDLDILAIGTNIAVGNNPISWLAMHRLARIQVASICSPVTTGMDNIDYYISGSLTQPEKGAQEQYKEKLITVEGSGYCFNFRHTESRENKVKLTRADWGLSAEQIIYTSGANFYKILPELREAWIQILAAVPNSILLLYPFSGWSNSYQVQPFLKQINTLIAKYGIRKSRLIVLKALGNRDKVKEILELADVYLDAYPYTGATSILDSLELGLPTVVRAGNTLRSLQASALLTEIEMTDLIAKSETEYINLAISLGNNLELRNSYKKAIEEKMANNPPFLDSKTYSQKIGRLLQQLFLTWERNRNKTNNIVSKGFGENKSKKQGKKKQNLNDLKQINSLSPQELFDRSRALKQEGNLEQAEVCLRQAISLKSDFWGAYNNLGTLLQSQGNLKEAKLCYQKAISFNANFAEAISNLASLWQLEEDFEKAKRGFYQALQLKPDYVPAHFNLANIFKEQKRLAAAVEHFEKVIALEPNYTEAYLSLAGIYEYQSKFTEALNCYQQVEKRDPDAYYIKTFTGYIDLKLCNWQDYDRRIEELISLVEAHLDNPKSIFSPFALSAFPAPLHLHKALAQTVASGISLRAAEIKERLAFKHRKTQPSQLRIGYISPDFRDHAVGRLIYEMFPHHDRSRFEIYAYSTVDVEDVITQEVRSGCDVFVDLSPLSNEAAARRIYGDGIHILIDLAGYTIGNGSSILALQPAPIQAQWLGYPDTMGAEFIQYYLGDRTLITREIADSYTEEIIYLPHTFVASPLAISEKVMTRAEFGLPEDAFVFCCFNSHYKITPQLFDIWMQILEQVPHGVLWLGSGAGMENLRFSAQKRGCDPNRLIFADKIAHAEYLARYALADLYLDTSIYNAGSTAAAVLWTGLPLLTCPGNTNASRMGASICAAAGLEATICHSVAEYKQKAVYLATHPQELTQMRQQLKEKLENEATYPPLFQVEQFVRSLESAFHQMWHKFGV